MRPWIGGSRRDKGVRCRNLLVLVCLWAMCVPAAEAGGPRFNPGIGGGWGVPPWYSVYWNQSVLPYFTDAGDLSAGVSHAQADAMVAAAAAVWTTPTSSIAYAQGGTLAEHVSPGNTYFDGNQVVFPADVQTGNEANIPVAIVYDTDGSVTDLLLGEGASDPGNCEQNAVNGDIDDIHEWNAIIAHATLVLNGRCVGSAPEQLTEMQYQLARAFGRVLGLAWSQANDNVFTAQTTITANQMAYWPLMHPIDVICGEYSYQCMTNPFSLRVDDLNALGSLYPVPLGNTPPGKQGTDADALWFRGTVYFPTGEGMDWVNVTAKRQNNDYTEDWEMTSAITGLEYQQAIATPVNATPATNSGFWGTGLDGFFSMRRVPLNGISNVFFSTEAINPLYTGDYALGPYIRPPSTPSGSPASVIDWSAQSAGDFPITGNMVASDGAASCDTGADGSEGAPTALDGSGWQAGLLCSWGHSSWWSVSIAAGHTWALEVTATDETGSASAYKALPVLGVWNAADATGGEPTVASQPVPFNSMSLGTTQMQMSAPDSDSTYRVAISDQYGAGRPDFTYTARLLYAAAVSPATVSSSGGRIAITGTGFRQGNQVLVNGAAANVVSWSATQIVAQAPPMAVAGTDLDTPVSVSVLDTSTGGSASVPAAFRYARLPNLLQQFSAPAALETGIAAAEPFAVRVVGSDGVTPVPGEAVSFQVLAGTAQLGVCGPGTACTAVTDAQGIAQMTVTGGAAGPITLQAVDGDGGATVQVTIMDTDPARSIVFDQPDRYVAAGLGASWSPAVQVQQDDQPAGDVAVAWTVSTGLTAVGASGTTTLSGAAGVSVSTAGVPAGSVDTVTACAWSQVCAVWSVHGVDPAQWLLGAPGGTSLSLPATGTAAPIVVKVTDLAGHSVEGAPVQIYQRVLAWEGDCATSPRCPSAPVLASSATTLNSDADGNVSVTPLTVPDVPQVTQIAASAGTQGFVTVTLVRAP